LYIPIRVPPIQGSSVVTWCIILFVYVFFASTLPVQKLLQPRDYINSHQLLVAIVLILIGLFVAHPVITAPAINDAAFTAGSDVPDIMPVLFITIACGAVSGFHSLASSGTTVKQVDRERDTLFIGYGGMLWESFLAVLVIMAVAGGLGLGLEKDGQIFTGADAFRHHYSSWAAFAGIDAKLEAFVIGTSNLFKSFGIPPLVGKSMIAVFIVSFANTTLDSAARIQRLSLQEIFRNKQGTIRKPMDNRYTATFFVVLAAMVMTFLKAGATGALILWPLFGSLNQLLAALALVSAVKKGLLGYPEMQVMGNGSTAYNLLWYSDRVSGPTARAWILSVPMYVYRLLMLAWALWLASSLISWLKWGWESVTRGGYWKKLDGLAKGRKKEMETFEIEE